MNFCIEEFKVSSFNKAELLKQDWIQFFWFKEKIQELLVVFLAIFLTGFFCSLCIPLKYETEAEFFLKKKSMSGFEAISMSKQIGEKLADGLSIEPFFYSKKIVETAIKKSAFQIQKYQPLSLRLILEQINLLMDIFFKKDHEKGFLFENCQFDEVRPLFFSIRKIAEDKCEILFQNRKLNYLIGEEIKLGSGCFSVASMPIHKGYWQTYKINPLEKTYKKVSRSLKIRVDKKTKSILIFKFFSKDKLNGEIFLKSLIDAAETTAEQTKKNALESELKQLNKIADQLVKEISLCPSQEEFEIKKIELQEAINAKIKIEKEILHLEEKNQEIKFLLQEPNFLQFSNLLPKDLIDLMMQKALLRAYKLEDNSPYQRNSRKELETILKEKIIHLKLCEEDFKQLEEIKEQASFTNLISYTKSYTLTKLFAQKKELEEKTKNLSQTEKVQLEAEQKKIQNSIESELNHLTKNFEDRIAHEKKEIESIQQAIYFHLDKEISYLKNQFLEELSFKISHQQFKIEQSMEILRKICEKIEILSGEIQHISTKIYTLQELLKLSFLNKEKIIQKMVEFNAECFLGEKLFSPKTFYYPDFILRFFLLLISSFILTIGYFCWLYIKAIYNGWFPSEKLILSFNWKYMKIKDLKNLPGKKLQLIKRKQFFNKNVSPFTKRLDDLQNFDYKFFDVVMMNQNDFTLREIEEIISRHQSVILY